MADQPEKSSLQADIAQAAIDEALRSVERVARESGGGDPATASELNEGLPVEVGGEGADPAEVASLKAQLELSQAKGRELMEKLKDEHDKMLRAAADLENYKKRALKEKDEIQKFGNERMLKDILPAVDNLDRALAAAPAGDKLTEGVKLVRASLEQALAKHGVKGFSAMGQPFDPARHEALMQVPTAEHAPGTVVLEHARGWTLNDRLLRPAMVGVSVAAPSGGEEQGG
ncbi:MAG: nucleotide exchange factor GrpE [Anaeromyxobacteraceae bacterium]